MAKRRTDEERLLELIDEKDAAYEVHEALERRGVSKPAAGDLLWQALRAGALGPKWRAQLFAWLCPHLDAMRHASGGFSSADLASLFDQLALALAEPHDASWGSEWDRQLDDLIAKCAGDRALLTAAHAGLADPARALIGSALARAGLVDAGGDERARLLQHAAECVLHGGDASLLKTLSDQERNQLVLSVAARDTRRYLVSTVASYLPHASVDELIAVGSRAWGERKVYDALGSHGEAALPALEREGARLLESDGEDEDWLVAVVARVASIHARRGTPFPEHLRPLIDRAVTLSRAPRKTLQGPQLPRENPFYAFAELVPLLPHDEVIDLALRSWAVHAAETVELFDPLGDAILPALQARALDLTGARKPALVEPAVIGLGLGRILARRGEALDARLDPLLVELVAARDLTGFGGSTFVVHDPSGAPPKTHETPALLAEVLRLLPIERREAVLTAVPKLPFYFFGLCPTPAVAARAVSRVASLDQYDVRDREQQIAAALRTLGPAALPSLLDTLAEPRLPARAPLVAALADLAATEALPLLASYLTDASATTAAEAKRGVSAIDPAARLSFATAALADRDRARRLTGALVLETLGASAEAVKLANEKAGGERAKAVREVLERIAPGLARTR